MEIDINAIINEYEDLSDIIENQEEILSEVELSLKEITGLQEFSGKTAGICKIDRRKWRGHPERTGTGPALPRRMLGVWPDDRKGRI